MNTLHQQRSASVLSNKATLAQLHTDSLRMSMKIDLLHMSNVLGKHNIDQYHRAKADKARGGEGVCNTKHFDN